MTGSVCVIIPTYNRSAMLRETINSVLAQTHQPQQIIVVNDGSTDDTVSVVESFGERITLINKENSGKAAALNLGLSKCTCDYVWICDDDDICCADGLATLIDVLEKNTHAALVYGTYKIFPDRNPTLLTDPSQPDRKEEPSSKLKFLENMFTFQQAMLVRKTAYDKVGLFDEKMVRSQDWEMLLRLTRNLECVSIDKVIFHQRKHEGARGSQSDKFDAAASMKKWMVYDALALEKVAASYTLDEFTPSFALNMPEATRLRLAAVEKACIFARRGVWKVALETLAQAAQANPAAATAEEFKLAEAIFINNPAVWQSLQSDRQTITLLQQARQQSTFCNDIIVAMCRPLVWQTRTALKAYSPTVAGRLIWLMFRTLGIRNSARRLTRSTFA